MSIRIKVVFALLILSSGAGAASLSPNQLPAAFAAQVRNGEVTIDFADGRIQSYFANEKLAAYAFNRDGLDVVLIAYNVLPGSQWDVSGSDPIALSGLMFAEVPSMHQPGSSAQFTLYFDQLVPGIPQWAFWSKLPQTTVVLQADAVAAGSGFQELSGEPDYIQSGNMTFLPGHEPLICIECSFFVQFNLLYLDYLGVFLQFNDADSRTVLFSGIDSYDATPYGWGLDIFASLTTAADTDSDGFPDSIDNCLLVANASQFDADGDGLGNICDADFNNDCRVNFADLALMSPEFLGSSPLFDLDGDGFVRFGDLQLMWQMFLLQPGPAAAPNLCSATQANAADRYFSTPANQTLRAGVC